MTVNPNLVGADNIFRMRFMTYTYETDPTYHARTSFYFGVMQDIAGMHAACRHLSIPELRSQGMTWVILRTRLHVDRYTAWPEDVLVETWAHEPRGLHMPRTIRGVDEQQKPLFQAQTEWAVLDIDHGFRPVRPQSITDTLKLPVDDRKTAEKLPRLVSYDQAACTSLETYQPVIHLLDTDGNRHVNNISYVNWALDSLPNDFRLAYKVSDIDVAWKMQTFLGDKVTVTTGSPDENPYQAESPTFYHKIVRTEADGKEMIVWEGTSVWKKREQLEAITTLSF